LVKNLALEFKLFTKSTNISRKEENKSYFSFAVVFCSTDPPENRRKSADFRSTDGRDLEPSVMSKFGSLVEPLGVDGLLKNLGFQHARSTIPKWLQRGLQRNALIKACIKILSDHDPSGMANQSSITNIYLF
jgi:hypothetical protein